MKRVIQDLLSNFNNVACLYVHNQRHVALSLCTIVFLQIKLFLFSNIFGVDLLALLHDQPVLSRKAARRGKRLLSNWSYVRRGQTTVNFEIRAGRVSALIRSQEQSSLRYFDGLTKPAHG